MTSSGLTGADDPARTRDDITVIPDGGTDDRSAGRWWNRAAGFARRHEDSLILITAVMLGFAVTARWFRWGTYVATGDIPPFIRDGLFPEVGSIWTHFTTGAGAPITGIGQTVEVGLLLITRTFDIPGWFAQWLLFGSIVGLAGAGAAYFARSFGLKARYGLVAALIAIVNPLAMTLLPNLLPYLSTAVVAFLGGMILRSAQDGGTAGTSPTARWFRPAAFALISTCSSYVSLNLPLLAIIPLSLAGLVVLTGLLWGRTGLRRCGAFLAKAIPLSLLVNLWWIVPTAQTLLTSNSGTTFTAVTDVSSWAFTQQRSSLANVASLVGEWGWPYPEYYPWSKTLDSGVLVVIRYALPLAAFAAPFVALPRRRVPAAWLTLSALVLIFVCKGLHDPLGGVNTWIHTHVPGFWLFRDPLSKFGPMLVLVYGALVALSVEGLAARRGQRSELTPRLGPAALVSAAVVSIVAFSFPMWTGRVIPDDRPLLPSAHVVVPDSWQEAANYLNHDRLGGKVLMLPYNDFYAMPTTWGFYGADTLPRHLFTRPVIMRVPESYYGERPEFDVLLTTVESALANGDLISAQDALRSLGVSHVVLRRDFDRSAFATRNISDPAKYEEALAKIAGPPKSFGVTDIFRVSPNDSTLLDIHSTSRGDASLQWNSSGPASYSAQVHNAPASFTLVFRDSFAEGWKLRGLPPSSRVEHVRVDGYANGWRITGAPATTSVVVEYMPARFGRWAIGVSWTAALLCVMALLAHRYQIFRRLRRSTP